MNRFTKCQVGITLDGHGLNGKVVFLRQILKKFGHGRCGLIGHNFLSLLLFHNQYIAGRVKEG